jgi:hypothetical protein
MATIREVMAAAMLTNEMANPPFIPSMPKMEGAKIAKMKKTVAIHHIMAVRRLGIERFFFFLHLFPLTGFGMHYNMR